MADIKQILDLNNNEVLPITSTEAVFNPDGATTVEGRLQALESNKQDKLIAGNNLELNPINSRLPEGYVELEYIKSSGLEYLVTNIKISNSDIIETEFRNAQNDGYGGLYGIYASGENSAFYANETYYSYDGSNNKVDSELSVDVQWHKTVHDFVHGKLVIDDNYGVEFSIYSFTNSVNTALFSRYYDGSYGYFFSGYVKYFKIDRNGNYILNLIPARRISDNEIGMYDLVSNTFFTNQGTGEFIGGSVINTGLAKIDFVNDEGFINSATNQLLHYYKKNEVYTQEEVDALVNVLSNFQYSVVNALPEPSASTMGIIYIYNGHRYITNEKPGPTYEMIDLGAYDIDLSDYVTEQELDASLDKRPIHILVTETQLQNLINNETWEDGVIYYTVEEE